MQTIINQPFTNVQLELLRAFSYKLPEKDLIQLKSVLAQFFAQKAMEAADKAWDEKEWSNDTVDNLLNTKLRKKNKQ